MRMLSVSLFVLSCLCGAYPAACASSGGTDGTIDLVEGWRYRWGDSPLGSDAVFEWLRSPGDDPAWRPVTSLSSFEGRGNHEFLWLRIRIPENGWEPAVLYVPSVHLAFEVYVGTRPVYSHGTFAPNANKYAHVNLHVVALGDSTGGRFLTLRFYSDTARIGPAMLGRAITIGSTRALSRQIIQRSLERTVLGGAAICIGLISLFIFFHRFRERSWYLLTLGIFSLTVGVFYMSFVPAFRLLFDEPARYYLMFVSFLTFPVFLYLFIWRIVRSRIMLALAALHLVWAIASVALDLGGVRSMPHLNLPTNILLAVTIVIAVGLGLREVRSGNPEARLFMIGLIVAMLFGFHDIFAGLELIPFVHWMSPWGTLILILLLVYIADHRFVARTELLKVYSRELETKSQQLAEYAHTLEQRVRDRTLDLDEKNRALARALDELRETQQQLVMREKMASLGNLVAGVAHEVNNPIGAINSAADASDRCVGILSEHVGDGDRAPRNPRVEKALGILRDNTRIITTAGKRVAEIVRSLRNFSRLDEAEFQEADLHDGLDSTLTLVNHKLKHRIEVVRDYGDAPAVECYANQLNQVFMNILVNAAQAIEGSGTIVVRTRRDGEYAVVTVSDTGRGIAPEHLDRLFDPGFTTKGVGVGTGLGLSISYKIIERHGGTIEVESEVGRGTTFTIRLPIRASEKEK